MTSRFQFVDDHRATFEVKRLCQVLDVNRSSYYKWLAGAEARAARQREDLVLAEQIRQVHYESGGAYGSPRATAELREKGHAVNEKQVARVMRTYSTTGIRLRRRVRTTAPDQASSPVPDLFQRDFTAGEPGRKPMGDITYLPLQGGKFLYLATVLDCFSRKIVGWPIADHMRTDLVADALRMAARTRGSLDSAVFHSKTEPSTDPAPTQASTTTSRPPGRWARSAPAPTTPPAKASTPPSNAKPSKAPTTTATPPPDAPVFAWLTRYNTRRRHSTNGHLSPDAYERRHHNAKLTLAA